VKKLEYKMNNTNIPTVSDNESENASILDGELPEPVITRIIDLSVQKKVLFIQKALDAEKDTMVEELFAVTNQIDDELVRIGGVPISIKDFSTLKEGGLLVDTIIDGYCRLIETKYNNVHITSCFFYSKLIMRNACFTELYRWFKNVNILQKKTILFPINANVHWFLVAIDTELKSVRYYDSLGHSGRNYREKIFYFYSQMCKDVYNLIIDETQWTSRDVGAAAQQFNGVDCGVFMLMNAEFLAEGVWAPLAFEQDDMVYFRLMMAFTILQREINYDI
jgi:Ulp1 family protease